MSKADSAQIVVGKIGATYGVHGWLKIHSYTEIGSHILDFHPWLIVSESGESQAYDIEDARPHGKLLIAKLKGINSPEEARLLTGKTITITRSQLPALEQGEYYWSDLEGLTVINQQGERLGKVIYLIATGANDVLVVKNSKEHAIPYLPGDTILSVDLAEQEILVDWESN